MNKRLCMYAPEKPREPSMSTEQTAEWNPYKKKMEFHFVINFDNGFDGVSVVLDEQYFKSLHSMMESAISEIER